jgi:peptidase E
VTSHIVALGGGGFSEESDNTLLDDYILGLSGSLCPRVCFLPTASGDAAAYIDKFYSSFPPVRAQATHLSVFAPSNVADVRSFLLKQQVIYVGGGSTLNLLAIWRTHGLDDILRSAWHDGIVLAGISAGMVCWFEEFLTDSYLGGGLRPCLQGLGFLPGSACPHYDDPKRRTVYRNLMETKALSDGVGCEGCVAVHYADGVLAKVVTLDANRTAYRVQLVDNVVVEEPLEAILLR